ncbi:MAG TPA: GNAT family N-acetyltransferase [Nitrolancea sp.]|nr:GNAT family N-acetyltransferase [Nitrolancea sp.]
MNTVDIQPLTLTDGSIIPARTIRPTDAEALQRFHRRLSESSIYSRHFGFLPELSDEQAHYFTDLDGVDRCALVALDPERPHEIVAVVRYDRDPYDHGMAEYAALVEDRWQGHGVGKSLTRLLIQFARLNHVERLYAMVLSENVRMIRLLHSLDLPTVTTILNGTDCVEVNLRTTEWESED